MDRYTFVLQYSDEELARARVKREQMIRHLIDEACINDGLRELTSGSRLQAFRLMMFALATYPGTALKNPRLYALALLLLLGPLGTVVAKAMRKWYVGRNKQEAERHT